MFIDFSSPAITDRDIVDIINAYPLYVLYENNDAEQLAQKFMIQNLKRVSSQLINGFQKDHAIAFVK